MASILITTPFLPIFFAIGYPERLLVYHAGTGRTVFIGSMKLTTMLLFSFSCLLVAPAFYQSPDWPNWMAVAGTCYYSLSAALFWAKKEKKKKKKSKNKNN
jgi:hypothetical protein